MLSPRDYDDAITIFSPEGRLYQVEYALELVKRGAPIVGVSSPGGAVLAANEAVESPLVDAKQSWKIFQLDDHVGAAIAGLSSDARILVEQARIFCQQHRLMYDEAIDIETLARHLGDLAQLYTQYAGVRPFGVSMIIAGVDKTGCKVFTTDPSGSCRGYRAAAVGKGSDEANRLFEERYRDDITLDEAMKLAAEAVRVASKEEAPPGAIKVAFISTETGSFRVIGNTDSGKRS